MRIETNATRAPKFTLMLPVPGIALSVDIDEPVAFIQEDYALTSDYKALHRWLVMAVVRSDELAAFWVDLGPATDFEQEIEGHIYRQPPYQQPIAFAHNVGECLEMAVEGRNHEHAVKRLHEQTMSSDLRDRYRRHIEQDMELIKNRSSFGPYARVERNGFSRTAQKERAERKAEMHG